jgi:hypothetical protein
LQSVEVIGEGMDFNFDFEMAQVAEPRVVLSARSEGEALMQPRESTTTSEATLEWSETMEKAMGAYGEAIRKLADR